MTAPATPNGAANAKSSQRRPARDVTPPATTRSLALESILQRTADATESA